MSSARITHPKTFQAASAVFVVLLAFALLFAAGGGVADAKKKSSKKAKAKLPVVTNVAPLKAVPGETLTLTGKNFVKGKNTVIVVFQRKGSKRKFTARGKGLSTKIATVKVPEVTADLIPVNKDKALLPTDNQYRLRVVTKFGASKASTAPAISPVLSPNPNAPTADQTAGDADCDQDFIINSADIDDDNDLLIDTIETAAGTEVCKQDTDGDGASDYYEYRVAYERNGGPTLPYPGLRPYPNPLVVDSTLDYDGDWLKSIEEFQAWQFTGRMDRFYSDANQDSDGDGVMDGAEDEDVDLLPNYAEITSFIPWELGARLDFVKTDTDGDGLCDGLDDEDHDGPPTPLAVADCTTPVPNNGASPTPPLPPSPAGAGDPDPARIDGDDNKFSNYYEWMDDPLTGAWYEPCVPESWPISPTCHAPIIYW